MIFWFVDGNERALDFREKMDGAKLYESNIEGTFELWIERISSD